MSLKDKVVLITGSGSGIGQATALLYAEHGCHIVVSDINEEGGQSTVEQVQALGVQAIFVKCNVAKADQVQHLVDKAVEHFGRIDIAVNNAGIGQRYPVRTADVPHDDWDRTIAVNQTGVFYCMQAEIKQMLTQGHGSIINIASMAGLRGLPNSSAYVASKHAVVGMTKTAALEYARNNIRVNAVCPVFTISPLFNQLLDAKEGIGEKLKRTIPLGRFAEASEMAEVIVWLSSDKAGFITGRALEVDGGQSA
ncbi:MAG: glucose 1-dehydrogenase [Bacteroidota bacterium]